MDSYRSIERDLMMVIASKFDLPWPMPLIVKRIDTAILTDEQRALMKSPPLPWADGDVSLGIADDIQRSARSPEGIYEDFIQTFKMLSALRRIADANESTTEN